jgi:hypothetical protein
MDTQDSKEKPQMEPPSREGLIKIQWEMINGLLKMLKDPELTKTEKIRVSTVLAYHVNSLNKMLPQKGEKDQFEEQNLGDFISGVEPRIARRFRRDFRIWKRALTSKR